MYLQYNYRYVNQPAGCIYIIQAMSLSFPMFEESAYIKRTVLPWQVYSLSYMHAHLVSLYTVKKSANAKLFKTSYSLVSIVVIET